MIKKLLKVILPKDATEARAQVHREVLREEARIGGQVFGPVPDGVRREFFCLDAHTWVWHEEWMDVKNNRRVLTTRYDVRPHGVFKAQDGQPYRPVSRQEAVRLVYAVRQYNQALNLHYMPLLAGV